MELQTIVVYPCPVNSVYKIINVRVSRPLMRVNLVKTREALFLSSEKAHALTFCHDDVTFSLLYANIGYMQHLISLRNAISFKKKDLFKFYYIFINQRAQFVLRFSLSSSHSNFVEGMEPLYKINYTKYI